MMMEKMGWKHYQAIAQWLKFEALSSIAQGLSLNTFTYFVQIRYEINTLTPCK
jgi:hypothetical protein